MSNVDDKDKYLRLIKTFDKLEESGQLDNSVKSKNDKNTIDKFLENSDNIKYLSKDMQEKIRKEKYKKEKKQMDQKVTEAIINKTNIDWNEIEKLYKQGIKQGYIK